ncbi:Anaerobic sulfatase-maturating enzyme [Methanosarcinales archaeon]|nr:radical SAM protein [Candidatus Methanoperedens sp.]CAG1001606.1 Anaerobic sulfatase-maturating enzyme [Methanosarcinales archaeon]
MQDNLVEEISTALLLEPVNLYQLCKRLEKELNLPSGETQHLIYQIVAQLNAKFFPPVAFMELILTEGCNLECSYCFENEMIKHKKMTEKVARAAIDLLFDYSQNETKLSITHFGGEPLLNFPMVQFVTEYAEDKARLTGKSVDFNMTSNGILLNESMAEYLDEHKINVLLSIDGCESTHDRHRLDKKGRGTFSRVMKSMRILKRTQPWIGTKMTVMPDNVASLFEDILGLYSMGVNQFMIGHATGVEWSKEKRETYGRELRKIAKWYRKERRRDLRIAELDAEDKGSSFFGCRAGRNSISVSVDGEISSCSKVLSLNNRQLLAKLGDVEYGLTNFSNRFELITCMKLRSACEALGIAEDFQGGCFAANYNETGALFQPGLQEHEFSLLERSIRLEFAPALER